MTAQNTKKASPYIVKLAEIFAQKCQVVWAILMGDFLLFFAIYTAQLQLWGQAVFCILALHILIFIFHWNALTASCNTFGLSHELCALLHAFCGIIQL